MTAAVSTNVSQARALDEVAKPVPHSPEMARPQAFGPPSRGYSTGGTSVINRYRHVLTVTGMTRQRIDTRRVSVGPARRGRAGHPASGTTRSDGSGENTRNARPANDPMAEIHMA